MVSYSCWASHYDAIYAFKDYEGDAKRLLALVDAWHPGAGSLLDVACGTGKHVALLGQRLEAEGLDLSDALLDVARKRCPDATFHCAPMESFELGRTYDVITCMFSAIAHVRTPARLRDAIASMQRHLVPGGLLVIEPWFSPGAYWTDTITSHQVEQPELKIAWMYTSRREGDLGVLDMSFLIGTPGGIEHVQEQLHFGLFEPDDYQQAFDAVGLERLACDDKDWKHGLHVARRPVTD